MRIIDWSSDVCSSDLNFRAWIPASAGMTVCGESRCTSFPPPSLHRPHKPQNVGMVVVHRGRRDADHVRLAPVAEHALGGEEVEQRETRVEAGQIGRAED